MNFKPLIQFLSNNQKEIIAGVFLLVSVAMSKDTPVPVVHNHNTYNTYNITNEAAAAPYVAPEYKAPRPHKLPHKQRPKPVVNPLPRPSCPCADSMKAGA